MAAANALAASAAAAAAESAADEASESTAAAATTASAATTTTDTTVSPGKDEDASLAHDGLVKEKAEAMLFANGGAAKNGKFLFRCRSGDTLSYVKASPAPTMLYTVIPCLVVVLVAVATDSDASSDANVVAYAVGTLQHCLSFFYRV